MLELVILGFGCSDALDKNATLTNLQAIPAAKSSVTGGTENAQPPRQVAKQGAAPNQDGTREPTTPERPTVYSALELAKIIDFTKLPAPKGATRAGHKLSSRLEMRVLAKVPEAAAFYLDQLAATGWAVDETAGKKTINESEATAFLTKNGHVISLAMFPTDVKKPECMVMLKFHGNLDARTLPRSEGAKLLHESPTRTIYTTTKPVAAEAEWIAKTLSAQGWQRYVRAKAAKAESDQRAVLDFRKRGYAMHVFMATASAQGNRTSVHYTALALAHELPAPPDATDVEFDDDAWTLQCDMPRPMDAGVAFYRQAMPAAGYRELPGEKPQDRYVNLRFGTDAGDVVAVQVAKKDDWTCTIQIYGVSAAMMERLRKEEGTPGAHQHGHKLDDAHWHSLACRISSRGTEFRPSGNDRGNRTSAR
jgi:hypothetical protein